MKSFRYGRRRAGLCAMLALAGMGHTNANSNSNSNSNAEDHVLEEVTITGHPLSAEGLAQPNFVLRDNALNKALAASIGETLVGMPSINSASFGQAVGRPVIRGQGGARVKMMEDRVDVMDVSVTSPDHAVSVDAAIADSIEVLMGPSTLLYGSGAIGGVVDVHTGRIPHTVSEETEAMLEVRGADNADKRSAAGKMNTSLGSLALHLDGFYREAGDYDIPGFAESRAMRASEESEHDDEEHEGEEHDEDGEVRGELPGSDFKTYGGAMGLSYVGESGFFGVSYSVYESDYGLPGHSHEHEHEEEFEHDDEEHEGHEEHAEEEGEEEGNAILELEQQRIDLEAGWSEWGVVDTVNFRLGYNDYEHVEFEPNGEAGTTFSNEQLEARLELVHSNSGNFTGAGGLQYSDREFSALGEEAFVQPVDTESLGMFYVGETQWANVGVEGGLRVDSVEHDPTSGRSRNFDLVSGSLGLILPLSDTLELTGQLDSSSRAPIAIELYSEGAHLATQSYEIGDAHLDEEAAFNISAGLSYRSDRWLVAFNAYYTDFDGFIYEQSTGEEIDELPVLQWTQEDAEFTGADLSAEWLTATWSGGNFYLLGKLDAVKAELDDGSDVPRIPPMRWSLGARLDLAGLQGELVYTHVDDQDDTADLELATHGYEDLRLYLEYGFDAGQSRIELFLLGTNLTDDEQRYHTSFIKDIAPQPGRTIEAGIRVVL